MNGYGFRYFPGMSWFQNEENVTLKIQDEDGILAVLFKDPQIQFIILIAFLLVLLCLFIKILNHVSIFMYDSIKFIILWMICMFIYQVLSTFVTPFFILQKISSIFNIFGVAIPIQWNITNKYVDL